MVGALSTLQLGWAHRIKNLQSIGEVRLSKGATLYQDEPLLSLKVARHSSDHNAMAPRP